MTFLTPEQFRSWDLFNTFEHTAYRLESRDVYLAEGEAEPFQQWTEGKAPQLDFRLWYDTMRTATRQGKRVERVRVVPDPLTDYLRFEAWIGQFNTEAGEDIRYLDRERAREISIPHLNHDYWLFDSHRLYQLHFDDEDRLTGVELIQDPEKIVQANRYRDAAWHYATPFPKWYAAHADECEPRRR